jgi:hypothetical protein
LQHITTSGIVSEEFDYAPNKFMSHNGEIFHAFVSSINKHNHCIYMRPECDMQYMQDLTEQLE